MQTLIDHNPGMAFSAEFSALKNLCRIFTIEKKKNGENYAFLNGVRVLALFWVIIGHSFLFNIMYTSNALDAITWTRNIVLQFIYNAEFSVDTFFVLSGLLTTVLFVRQVEKDKKLSPRLMFLYYIHRYIRLTPTFLLIVAISINLTPYFGSGPLYPTQQGFETPQCRTKYWWTSILYVGNIVKPDYVCVPVSWYLHNDMQFHWIAPLTLIPFVLGRKPLAFVVSTVLVLVGIGSIAGLLIYYPDLQASDSLAGAPSATVSSLLMRNILIFFIY
jgi:peptidoglycan/LPS O-acetylase OafA/YrhL